MLNANPGQGQRFSGRRRHSLGLLRRYVCAVARFTAFRMPCDSVVKLDVGAWDAGPLFSHHVCLFFNLENLDTNKRDFDAAELPNALGIEV